MIASFRSKPLKQFWWDGNSRRLPAQQIARITILLNTLEIATIPEDMNQSGFYFHGLKGQDQGRYSVRVTANYRITFEFEETDAIKVDYEDYH